MFCKKCGTQIADGADVCPSCKNKMGGGKPMNGIVNELSNRVKIDGIIWIVIGILQVLAGLLGIWSAVIVGVLNIITAVGDLKYSKEVLESPVGIVEKFKPLTSPIINLLYNMILGGIIGVVGSIYYLVAVRSYVMNNESAFMQIEENQQ